MECPFQFIECLQCGHIQDYSHVPDEEPIDCANCGARLSEAEE